jgi:hypothetical protein
VRNFFLVAGTLCAAVFIMPAPAQQETRNPACDELVQPEQLAALSGHPWRSGPGISIGSDKLVCNYYQDDVPAGLSLLVHADPRQQAFRAAQDLRVGIAERVEGLGDAAFAFRLASTEPFQPSWGLIVSANDEVYHLEGVPEAGDAARARAFARELMLRVMKKL